MRQLIRRLFPKKIVDIILDYTKSRKVIIRHLDIRIKKKHKHILFMVGVVSSEYVYSAKQLNCESANGDQYVTIRDEFIEYTPRKILTEDRLLLFEYQVCPFCYRFHRFCVCYINKKPLWYLRICNLPDESKLFMDITCTRACIFPHIIHFPIPKCILRGLACDFVKCNDIIESQLLQHCDPAVVYCKNKDRHLNMLF